MLVLSRKKEESIVIVGISEFAGLLKVTVLAIHGGQVKLGFEVDKDVPIFREELWKRISLDGHAGNGHGGLRAGGLDRRILNGGNGKVRLLSGAGRVEEPAIGAGSGMAEARTALPKTSPERSERPEMAPSAGCIPGRA